MKKLIIIIALGIISISVNAQVAKVEIKTSAICEMCKDTIEKDLAFEKGVKTAELDLNSKVLTVEYNAKKTSPDKIRTRITKVGYNADTLKREEKAYNNLPDCCKDGAHADDR